MVPAPIAETARPPPLHPSACAPVSWHQDSHRASATSNDTRHGHRSAETRLPSPVDGKESGGQRERARRYMGDIQRHQPPVRPQDPHISASPGQVTRFRSRKPLVTASKLASGRESEARRLARPRVVLPRALPPATVCCQHRSCEIDADHSCRARMSSARARSPVPERDPILGRLRGQPLRQRRAASVRLVRRSCSDSYGRTKGRDVRTSLGSRSPARDRVREASDIEWSSHRPRAPAIAASVSRPCL